VKRGFADLGYSLRATDKWEMTFNLTYTRSTLDIPEYPNVNRDSNEALLEWTNFVTFSRKDRLTVGTLYSREAGVETYSGVTPSLIVADGSRPAGAFYVQHEHKLTDDLKLIGGVQANKIGNIAWDAVPRAGILWNPAPHFTLKLLYGSAFRAPSLDETLLNHPGLKGNPNLVPEKVGTLDAQISYQSNRAQASVDYFHSRQARSIVQDGSTFPAHYYNLGSAATIQGVDAEGKCYIRSDWFFMAAFLYQANQGGLGKVGLTPIPSLGAKAGLSYLSESGSSVSFFDAFQGRVTGYEAALNPAPRAFHSVNAHARLDLSKRWLRDGGLGFALFVNANDLTNRQLWLPAWGSGTPQTIPVLQGRTIYFGIEVWRKPR
jgi:outer membrane receptor protein involved in Fe transport